MKNPQTLAIELNEMFPNPKMKNIGDNACCALVTLWCLGIEPDEDIEAIKTIQRAIDAKVIKSDCVVKWFDFTEWLTGRQLEKVDFIDITSILGIKERTPVYFERTYKDKDGKLKKKGHWVGVENARIGFNPLKTSLCVLEGKPVTMRKLVIKKA